MSSEIAPPLSTLPSAPDGRRPRIHPAWPAAAVAFLALVGAAAFRAAPSVLIEPLHADFGWSRASISAAVSVNLVLYGLTAPFAAALMERFGIRKVVTAALALIALGSGLTVFMSATWQLVLLWGVMVGLGTGSMALAFVATVTDRWFVARRGLVTGILTAGGAAGQLVFLPVLAMLAERYDWQTVSLTVSSAALAVVPLVLMFLRNRPEDIGATPYGAPDDYVRPTPPASPGGPVARALGVLRSAARTRVFWLLAGTFAICGASTNGLVGTHFVPAAHDHGMPVTAAASLLAVIGIFDLIGTIASGWFTDRFDSRKLLGIYYLLRGISLMLLPLLFANTVHPPMIAFIIFYGLDWVATVPPTVALCRKHFGADGPIVFGWVLASHQIGAGLVAFLAGLVRDHFGGYDAAFYVAGGLCAVAAVMALAIAKPARVATR
ncbi:MFS transporter [Rhodococcus sp. ABRD24]|uniref:MFS transporter n=1 Tax=Rhodococcus sp. ABRD24 TaxID=2507582 RepID=UPI001F6036B8|nr:MFS transporter [Rhodococcus sp. ABRD24]